MHCHINKLFPCTVFKMYVPETNKRNIFYDHFAQFDPVFLSKKLTGENS